MDLDTSVFEKSDEVIEEGSDIKKGSISSVKKEIDEGSIKELINLRYKDQPITIENQINNSFL